MKSTSVTNFLNDMEKFSIVECLEEGQEKNELLESARKRGILVDPDFGDLGIIKTIFGFTDKPSSNGQIVVESKLLKVLPQIVGRPMNVNHTRKFIVGSYIDFRYIAKKKQVIAYATFFRSVYPLLWEKAKTFQKAGRLSSSFEIFAPKKLRKYIDNKNYEMNGMAMIGGAIVFEENGTIPAFADAKVLEMACDMSKFVGSECLEYATKYSDEEIIVASNDGVSTLVAPNIASPAPISVITCQGCKKAFTPATVGVLRLTCPDCKSIIDPSGQVLLPPQIKDYNLSCSCGGGFTILKSSEDTQTVQCNECGKKYALEFYSSVKPEALKLINFIYETEKNCPQCGQVQAIDICYGQEPFDTICKKCGMKFPVDVKTNTKRKVKKISLIDEKAIEKKRLEEEEVEKAHLIKGIKKLVNKNIETATTNKELKLKIADLEKATRKGDRLNKVLMIARELKGKLIEAFSNKSLKDKELEQATSELKNKDEEINKITVDLEKATAQTALYKENANKILTRRKDLGVFAKDMSDEQILDEKDFEIATLKQKADDKDINDIEVATDIVGEVSVLDGISDADKKIKEGVDNVAFNKK